MSPSSSSDGEGKAAVELLLYYSRLTHSRFNNFILMETLFTLALATAWDLRNTALFELAISLAALLATLGLWVTLIRAQTRVARLTVLLDEPARSLDREQVLLLPAAGLFRWLEAEHRGGDKGSDIGPWAGLGLFTTGGQHEFWMPLLFALWWAGAAVWLFGCCEPHPQVLWCPALVALVVLLVVTVTGFGVRWEISGRKQWSHSRSHEVRG